MIHFDLLRVRFKYFLSISLVWSNDLYVPAPPYPITSVSLALAWGLPDKPTYPEDDLMQAYEDGDLPLLDRRKDVNVTNNVATKESMAMITPTNLKSRIDPESIMKLLHLFLSDANSAASADTPVGFDPKYIDAILDTINSFGHSIHRQDPDQYQNATTTTHTHANRFNPNDYSQFSRDNAIIVNRPYPPMVSAQSNVADKLVDRNANNTFRRYLAETYFRPWVESISSKEFV